ncbi:MAG TPA: hypothetical protein VM511_04925, partial [Luteolibacter sp.]|nr:hypothetical protein [Luteolibacter sp.]
MNLQLLLASLLGVCFTTMVCAAGPKTRSTGFDAAGQFTVEAETPAGVRQAVLEISDDLSAGAVWRPMIAKDIDGRAARVLFRLPPQSGPKLFARVKT